LGRRRSEKYEEKCNAVLKLMKEEKNYGGLTLSVMELYSRISSKTPKLMEKLLA
jgi:hypothetical protein